MKAGNRAAEKAKVVMTKKIQGSRRPRRRPPPIVERGKSTRFMMG
jgi:hypothetical protein